MHFDHYRDLWCVPRTAPNALEALSSEVRESWKTAVEKIEGFL